MSAVELPTAAIEIVLIHSGSSLPELVLAAKQFQKVWQGIGSTDASDIKAQWLQATIQAKDSDLCLLDFALSTTCPTPIRDAVSKYLMSADSSSDVYEAAAAGQWPILARAQQILQLLLINGSLLGLNQTGTFT